ncbi:MAG: hypothetical protein KDD43_03700 [Bdellovibrionales bacterium]|nr:hypothetical protein [Bdellovibrionales bacterium]
MEEIKELPAVAQRICLECKKCACERFFTVIAHTTKTSAKVECEVCKAKKTYKLPTKKKTGKKKVTRRSAADKHSDKWTELRDQFGGGDIVPYKMNQEFTVNTAIQHPKFGLGIVTEASGHAIQVTFEDVDRALVHNRT